MDCRISSSVIGSRASPSTLWTDNRYCVIVVLLVTGGHFPPLTQLRTGLAQTDRYQEKLARGGVTAASTRRSCASPTRDALDPRSRGAPTPVRAAGRILRTA